MRDKIVGTFFAMGMLFLAACTPKAVPISPPLATKPMSEISLGQTWEGKWTDTVAAAKKEGRIVLTTSAGRNVGNAVMEGFRKAYGIDVEVVVGTSYSIMPPIEAERKAGLFLRDVLIAGTGPTTQSMKPAGMLAPLGSAFILPELNDPEKIKNTWYQGDLQWVDKDHMILLALLYPGAPLAINTNMVNRGDISSWNDLLNPKWKGKMAWGDPSAGGTGINIVVWADRVQGWDWLQQLVKNEPVIIRDTRVQMDWLARGKVSIVLGPTPATLVEFKEAGAPVQSLTPKEGTWMTAGSAGVSIFNRTPHPNATRVFINWLLSKEGLTILSKVLGGQSIREDVPTNFLDPEQVRQSGVNYFNKEKEDILLARVEMTNKAMQILAPLMK